MTLLPTESSRRSKTKFPHGPTARDIRWRRNGYPSTWTRHCQITVEPWADSQSTGGEHRSVLDLPIGIGLQQASLMNHPKGALAGDCLQSALSKLGVVASACQAPYGRTRPDVRSTTRRNSRINSSVWCGTISTFRQCTYKIDAIAECTVPCFLQYTEKSCAMMQKLVLFRTKTHTGTAHIVRTAWSLCAARSSLPRLHATTPRGPRLRQLYTDSSPCFRLLPYSTARRRVCGPTCSLLSCELIGRAPQAESTAAEHGVPRECPGLQPRPCISSWDLFPWHYAAVYE
ncbi:hypothetical protein PSPO01_09118 [Paraphaeosphaeria sporulosa]